MTVEGYQAWEVLLKLSEPSLGEALEIAKHLNLDMELMTELLSPAIQGMRQGINECHEEIVN